MNTEEIYNTITEQNSEQLDKLKEAVIDYELKYFREEVITNLATVDELITYVCKRRGVTKAGLASKDRKRGMVEARHVIWYLLKNKTVNNFLTLQQMGVIFNRDHATALWGIKKVETLMTYDRELREEIMLIANHFGKRVLWDVNSKTLTYEHY